jgi:hypothetical protein
MNFSRTPGNFDAYCGFVLANRNTITEAAGKFLEWQLEHVAYVFVMRKAKVDSANSGQQEVEYYAPPEFGQLKTVLDEAHFIYCFGEAEELYGHLRCNPTHRDEPIGAVHGSDSKDCGNPFLDGVDTKSVTVKRIDLQHADTTTCPDQNTEATESNQSVRWIGVLNTDKYHETNPKLRTVYFSEQEMIRWRFKTCSITDDVRASAVGMGPLSFKECLTQAALLPWFKADVGDVKLVLDDEDMFAAAKAKDFRTLSEKAVGAELKLLQYIVQETYGANNSIRWPRTKWVAVTQGSKKKMPVTSMELTHVKKS